jgi:hypothetical protein
MIGIQAVIETNKVEKMVVSNSSQLLSPHTLQIEQLFAQEAEQKS